MDLKSATESILLQLDDVVSQLTQEEFRRSSKLLNNSTIGQHVRHTLEFFICLMDGMPDGVVNYDKRHRDKMIEQDIDFARRVIQGIRDFVKSCKANPTLQLEACFGAEEDDSTIIPSNYLRELTYNIEHAIHHMALIRVAVNEFCSYIQLPEDFGVASSTIRNKYSGN